MNTIKMATQKTKSSTELKNWQIILLAAADLIEHVGWSQGAYARDYEGYITHECNPLAVGWCAAGAMQAVADDCPKDIRSDHRISYEVLTAVVGNVVCWNDETLQTPEKVAARMREVALGG